MVGWFRNNGVGMSSPGNDGAEAGLFVVGDGTAISLTFWMNA